MQMQGIYPAIVTPFGADDRVDYSTFKRLIDHLIENGVAGIVPCGTTGEYYAMTLDERREVLKFFKDYVGNRVQLIAGTNAASTRDVVSLTQYAQEIGYDAVLLAPPYYSLPTQSELLAHFQSVIGSSSIPIVLYNFHLRAGVEISDAVMAPLAETGRICAIKESSGSMGRVFNHVLNYSDKVDLCCGSDDQALDYFLWGATSWIAGASTFTTRQHVEIHRLSMAGDWVKAITDA